MLKRLQCRVNFSYSFNVMRLCVLTLMYMAHFVLESFANSNRGFKCRKRMNTWRRHGSIHTSTAHAWVQNLNIITILNVMTSKGSFARYVGQLKMWHINIMASAHFGFIILNGKVGMGNYSASRSTANHKVTIYPKDSGSGEPHGIWYIINSAQWIHDGWKFPVLKYCYLHVYIVKILVYIQKSTDCTNVIN